MEDFAYLVQDSNAAWLEGRGDGRVEAYEGFYASERSDHSDDFDLEATNEQYAKWIADRPSRKLAMLNAPLFGRAAVALFSIYIAAKAFPVFASKLPYATGGLLVVAFVSLRVFHRQRRKSQR
ncbi:MAG: hypothetical protein KGQ57_00130 [Burkholderiales bacterium]|nr:hypothetical protein [Burkholderiales bacterium]